MSLSILRLVSSSTARPRALILCPAHVQDFRLAFKSFTDEVSALYLDYLTGRASSDERPSASAAASPSTAAASPSSSVAAPDDAPSTEVANDERWGNLYAASSAKLQSFLMAVRCVGALDTRQQNV